ncbi:hypothetical protein CLAVI_000203 [Candidatus Clavichlamydia salmonicola]|uniref:hypothetical protein n=1 Tax=Candidatus Clavichlamydia salmonicola TaxID=469812 RepID=UPI0018910555|nr:hypothetical protein [Candidatus Clavichlamydia salmonicola]MBF5050592.1 hypothetical protein [Candidatus Clavichlamydia salmonicola]
MSSSITSSSNQIPHRTLKKLFFKHKYPNCKITLQIIGIILSGLTAIALVTSGLILGSWAITTPGIALIGCLMASLIISYLQDYKKQTSVIEPCLRQHLEEHLPIDQNKSSIPIAAHTDNISTSAPFDPESIKLTNPMINPRYRVFADQYLAQLQTTFYNDWGIQEQGDYFITLCNLKNGIWLTLAQISHLKKPLDTSFIDNVYPNSTFTKGFIHEILSDRSTPGLPFRLSYEPLIDDSVSLNFSGPFEGLSAKEYLPLIKERFFLTFQKIEENNFSHVQMPLINRNAFITDKRLVECGWSSACYNLFLNTISNLSSESPIKHVILIDPEQPLKPIELAANFCQNISPESLDSGKNKPITKTTYLILE